MLRDGELEEKEVEVQVADSGSSPIGQMDIPGMPPGQMINLSEMMKGMMGRAPKDPAHDRGRRPRRLDAG